MNAAVVGLGIGEEHARAYVERAGCTLRWVHDLDPARADAVIARLGTGRRAASFEAILADPGVDVVSVATYDDAHATQVEAALRAGKHVFVEKPLCRSASELAAIATAWRASGRALASNLVLRTAPAYRWLREAIRAGEFGQVYAFDGDYLYGRVHKVTEGWRKDVPDYSVMQGGGIHLMDLMLWLTGQRPQQVVSAGSRLATEGTAFRYEDFVSSTFRFAGGMVGRITANFACVHPHQHVVRVFGTKATFLHDDLGPRVHYSRDEASAAKPLALDPLPESKGELIPEFVSAIAQGRSLAEEGQEHFDVLSACLAADAATTTHCFEDIKYL